MAPAKTIKITYDLKLPSTVTVEAGDKPTSRTFQYEVVVVDTHSSSTGTNNEKKLEEDGVKAYCAALRKTLEVARNEVGDEITKWRDLVGKAELSKEPGLRKGRGGEDGDEDEDGDEGDEGSEEIEEVL